jgi:hypothetical protein
VDKPLSSWARLAADPPEDLDPWEAARLDWLGEMPGRLAAAGWLGGDTLVHGDLRADNLLLGPGNTVAFVDWQKDLALPTTRKLAAGPSARPDGAVWTPSGWWAARPSSPPRTLAR